MNIEQLKTWIGRNETAEDIAAAGPLTRLAALLDHEVPPWAEGEVPPLAHWLYFLPAARQSWIDTDGHPRRGGFLPPVDWPRRMWAGSRLSFHAPIAIGTHIFRRSTIRNVSEKTGAGGRMVFVTVHHEIGSDKGVAIREEQDIVFREVQERLATPVPETRGMPARPSEHTRLVTPDVTQLFRFSALTFNAHRIHYDRDYARDVEAYPGLVVQGPYMAVLLMDHFLRLRPARVQRFSFCARRPLFDGSPVSLCLQSRDGGADLWARDENGYEAMTAEISVS
jgi:3-methylfumaryl-CoA hydratase